MLTLEAAAVGWFNGAATPPSMLVHVSGVAIIVVVIKHADRKWISLDPLHLPAMHSHGNAGMWIGMHELDDQRVNLARVYARRHTKQRERIEKKRSIAPRESDPGFLSHNGLHLLSIIAEQLASPKTMISGLS
jgi:hypothetical protein